MTIVTIPEALWAGAMMPQGVLERWLVADGALVAEGEAVAVVLVEDARHDLLSPASGILRQNAGPGAIVDPGAEIGLVAA